MQIKDYHGDYGVSLPQNVSIPMLKPCVIPCPSKGIGIIKLPRKNNFIALEKSNYNASSVMELCLNEMKVILSGVKSGRAGAAGGFMLPNTKSRNLSKIRENERILTIRKNSVAMALSYRSKDGKVKEYNSVYTDLLMRYLSSRCCLTLDQALLARLPTPPLLRSNLVLAQRELLCPKPPQK